NRVLTRSLIETCYNRHYRVVRHGRRSFFLVIISIPRVCREKIRRDGSGRSEYWRARSRYSIVRTFPSILSPVITIGAGAGKTVGAISAISNNGSTRTAIPGSIFFP